MDTNAVERAMRPIKLNAKNALLKPQTMRRLAVPLTQRLDRAHLTLQAAFGWTNSHLFEFFVSGVRASPSEIGGDLRAWGLV